MNILFVIHHELDPNAGAAGVTLQLGKEYCKAGHTVDFFSYDSCEKWKSGKKLMLLFPIFVALKILTLSRKDKIDIIYASTGDLWFWQIFFAPFLKKSTRPLTVTQSHGLEHTMHEKRLEEAQTGQLKLSWKYPIYNGGILLWQVRESLRFSDLCFLLNQYDADIVKNKMQVDPGKVKIFPNGIPDEFIGLPFQPCQTKASDSPGIAMVGSYLRRKGIHYAVPALTNMMKKYLSLKVYLLGVGVSIEEVLNDFSPELHERLIIVPFFEKINLPDLLKNSHILLFPSLSEGFPLAVPEAMACGLVPVVSNIPGPTEIVINEQNGLIIEPRNQSVIEESIERLINDSELLQNLSSAAYETAQYYDWKTIADQQMEAFQEVMMER